MASSMTRKKENEMGSSANGSLTPVLGKQFPLADAAKAHEAIMEPGVHGKIVLIP